MASKAVNALKGILEWLVVFAIALVVVLLLRTYVIEPYTVPSASMEPTIEVGDNIFAQKLTLEFGGEVEVGDIVVFENPDSSSDHDVLVKRVIATEGQTVDLVDGEALDEDYTQGSSYPLSTQAEGVEVSYPYTVPEGCVWLMGDNRENSSDSRYFGAVSCDNLIGIVCFRYWPLDRIGVL